MNEPHLVKLVLTQKEGEKYKISVTISIQLQKAVHEWISFGEISSHPKKKGENIKYKNPVSISIQLKKAVHE